MAAAPKPPVGTVIEAADGSHSIYDGKNFVPAAQDEGGNWGRDQAAMARLGMGGNGKAGELSPEDQKQVSGIQTQASGLEGLTTAAQDFIQRNARTKTGGLLAIPGAPTIAKAFSGPSSDLAAMDRDSVGMATSLRAPGQRLTQMEFLKNLGSGPSVRNTLPENMNVAHEIFNGNTKAQAKASFFTTYLNTHRTLDGAIPAWLSWSGQHFDTTGNYSHEPITQGGNAALKAQSAQSQTPVTHGMTVDVFGRPVQQ
jgi:hypothetical protein